MSNVIHPIESGDGQPPERLWSYRDAAEYFGVTERTVRRMVTAGTLMAVRIGGSVRFDPADVRRCVDPHKSAAAAGGAA